MQDDSLERIADLSAKLEGLVGRRVDVIPVRSAEAVPELLADAIAEGRVLVNRDASWTELRGRERTLRRNAQRGGRRRRAEALAGIDRMLSA